MPVRVQGVLVKMDRTFASCHLSRVEITRGDSAVEFRAPYHPDFVHKARNLKGVWNRSTQTWAFDVRDLEAVREIVRKVYGWEGTYPVEVTDVRVVLRAPDGSYPPGYTNPLWLLGRLLAERPHRDARVRTGPGVLIVSGGFTQSAGSRKYPDLGAQPGTVLEVRDVPLLKVEAVGPTKWAPFIEEVAGRRRTVCDPSGPTLDTAPGPHRPLRQILLEEAHT